MAMNQHEVQLEEASIERERLRRQARIRMMRGDQEAQAIVLPPRSDDEEDFTEEEEGGEARIRQVRPRSDDEERGRARLRQIRPRSDDENDVAEEEEHRRARVNQDFLRRRMTWQTHFYSDSEVANFVSLASSAQENL